MKSSQASASTSPSQTARSRCRRCSNQHSYKKGGGKIPSPFFCHCLAAVRHAAAGSHFGCPRSAACSSAMSCISDSPSNASRMPVSSGFQCSQSRSCCVASAISESASIKHLVKNALSLWLRPCLKIVHDPSIPDALGRNPPRAGRVMEVDKGADCSQWKRLQSGRQICYNLLLVSENTHF